MAETNPDYKERFLKRHEWRDGDGYTCAHYHIPEHQMEIILRNQKEQGFKEAIKKVIDLLHDEGYLKYKVLFGREKEPKEKCGCCFCKVCNRTKDDCVCENNKLLLNLLSLTI